MDRRNALRVGATLAVGVPLAGCDAAGTGRWVQPTPAGSASPSSTHAPAPSPAPPALPPEVIRGPADQPKVALTFHGQGDPAQARALLGELEKGGAKVTVLAVGSWLQAQPEMAKRILDGGHELGNHTQDHLDISNMDAARAFAEINTCALLLKKLAGSIGTWFRPSQTQYSTPLIRAQAVRAGYRTCLSYDLDSLDYTDPGVQSVRRNIAASIQNGSIVSMHFGHAGTVTAIPQILADLNQRGLRPVTMTELMGL